MLNKLLAQQRAAEAWVKTACPGLACPACMGKDHGFKEFVMLPSVVPGQKWDTSIGGVRFAAFTCKTCGYTWLFSTEAMKLP